MNFFEQCSVYINEIQFLDSYKVYETVFNDFQNFIFLGNGGSNAVAAHISQDYMRTSNKKSVVFSDPSMLTCFVNDYGYENAFRRFLEIYYTPKSFVILISSSGESNNIINCVKFCNEKNASFGVLTGFDKNNTVKTLANATFNYHVNSNDYGIVECIHQIFLHGAIK